MTLKEKLQKAWENKSQIAEGFYNAYISSTPEIKAEAERRLNICRSNVCGFHDKDGLFPVTVIKRHEACGLCGCKLDMKCASMQVYCALKDIGRDPLWEAVTTQDQENTVNEIQYKRQFDKKEQ